MCRRGLVRNGPASTTPPLTAMLTSTCGGKAIDDLWPLGRAIGTPIWASPLQIVLCRLIFSQHRPQSGIFGTNMFHDCIWGNLVLRVGNPKAEVPEALCRPPRGVQPRIADLVAPG